MNRQPLARPLAGYYDYVCYGGSQDAPCITQHNCDFGDMIEISFYNDIESHCELCPSTLVAIWYITVRK